MPAYLNRIVIAAALMALSSITAAEEFFVNFQSGKFVPDTLNITAGDKVVFENRDRNQADLRISTHNITGNWFDSPAVQLNKRTSYTFTQPGTSLVYGGAPQAKMKVVITK